MLKQLFWLGIIGAGGYYGGKAAGLWGKALPPSPSTAPLSSPTPASSLSDAPAAPELTPPPPGYTGPLPPFALTPYPGPGAWQTNASYIKAYQGALTYLAAKAQNSTWDPLGVDGKYGIDTKAAVSTFQTDHGLTADGEVGPDTASAIEAALLLVNPVSPA